MTLIRPASSADHSSITHIAGASGLFAEEELPFFAESLVGIGQDGDPRHLFISETEDGAAMLAPETLSDNVWNMLFLAVVRDAQRGGVGRALVAAVEDAARGEGARLLLIDTSSDEDQSAARAFYVALGYRQEAVIRDYYGDGVDRVTFLKRL